MLKKSLVVLGSIVFLLSGLSGAGAAELELKPFLYTQDFEETDPVRFWVTDGKYTVNFKGLTEERAYSGKKSFKLDVTFQEGTYFKWYIPIKKIPAEGKLKFSCRMLVEGEDAFCIGTNVIARFLPRWSGCGRMISCGSTKGEWELKESDFVKHNKNYVRKHAEQIFGAQVEDVGTYTDKIVFFPYYGRKGQKLVVYIDDIKLEGEIPSQEDYDRWTDNRWAALKGRHLEKIDGWLIRLEKIKKRIKAISTEDSSDKEFKEELESQAGSLKERIEKIKEKGVISSSEHKSVETLLSQLSDMCKGS